MGALEILRDLIALDSRNPFQTVEHKGHTLGVGNEQAVNRFIETYLQARGFEVERQIFQKEVAENGTVLVPERWNVLAKKGSGKRAILFYGHTDTVGIKEGWESDPFVATERVIEGQRRLYGLGANDMKGGLATLLALADEAIPSDVTVKFAFLADEEYWSFGAEALCQSAYLGDVAIAVTPEIATEAASAERQWIGLGRLGRSEFVISLRGVACHGADALRSESALNAAYEVGKVAVLVEEFALRSKRSFNDGELSAMNSIFVSEIRAGDGTLSVPDAASLIVDAHLLPGENSDLLREKLEQLLESARSSGRLNERIVFEVRERPRPTPPCEPYLVRSASPCVSFLRKLFSDHGYQTGLFLGAGVADENRFAKVGISTLIVGPSGANFHSPNEWVDIESLLRLEREYRLLLENSASLLTALS